MVAVLTALQAQARAAFQDTLLVSTQAQLELARARQQVGAATTLDVRRAEVQVGQQQVAKLREQNTAELEKLRLFQQMGVEQPADVRLTTTFGIEEPSVQLQQVLDLARRSNPGLIAQQSRQRSSDAGVAAARSSYLPTLSLQTGISGFSQQLTDIEGQIATSRRQALSGRASCFFTDSIRVGAGLGPSGQDCSGPDFQFTAADEARIRSGNSQWPVKLTRSPLSFAVQLSMPIFDGFQREQRVQEAQATNNDARYRLREQELRLTADVTSAYRELTTAYQTVRLQEQNSATAREALALAQERFRVGATRSSTSRRLVAITNGPKPIASTRSTTFTGRSPRSKVRVGPSASLSEEILGAGYALVPDRSRNLCRPRCSPGTGRQTGQQRLQGPKENGEPRDPWASGTPSAGAPGTGATSA